MLRRILDVLGSRRTTPEEQAFASRVQATLDEVRRICDEWAERVEASRDYAALANRAAVRRWELTRAANELSASSVPPGLRRDAEESVRAVVLIADAFHRVAQGYRFSKFERVCEGQALLEAGRERCRRLGARLGELAATRG